MQEKYHTKFIFQEHEAHLCLIKLYCRPCSVLIYDWMHTENKALQ